MALLPRLIFGASINYADTVAPTLASASIPAAGTSLSIVLSKAVRIGAGGNGGFTIAMSGGAVTLTYASGANTSTWVYTTSRTINSGETCSDFDYTQPGNGVESLYTGVDLATFTNQQASVTNNSTAGSGGGQVASDTFESYSADASLAAQANWDAVTGAMIVKDVSGNKYATGNSSILNSACVWVGAGTFNESQYSEGVIRWSGGTGYIAVIVNAGVGVETWYAALVLPNSSQVRLDKVVAGSLTTLATVSQGLSTGNSIKLIRTGSGSATRLTVQVDTGGGYTDIITNNDPGATYISGGAPGLLSYDNLLTASLASWAGGNN